MTFLSMTGGELAYNTFEKSLHPANNYVQTRHWVHLKEEQKKAWDAVYAECFKRAETEQDDRFGDTLENLGGILSGNFTLSLKDDHEPSRTPIDPVEVPVPCING